MIESQDMATLDWMESIELSSGDQFLAKELLGIFVSEFDEFRDDMHQAYLDKDSAKHRDLMHRMQGGCAYCGVPLLRKSLKDAQDFLHDDKSRLLTKPALDEMFQFLEDVREASATYLTD